MIVVDLSVSMEGVFGLTWQDWKRLIASVEDLGFASLYLSDHFLLPAPPDQPSVELIVALTYLADHTERVRFGPMVSPLSFRDPVLLARQAAALYDLSDGRMVLGVGTGWMEREHTMFGYDLGDVPTRFDRLEEGLEVITRLLRSNEPVDFEGQHFRLRQATLPGPRGPEAPPIMIGGTGPKRTLPLVARFADIWNAQAIGPAELLERSAMLDEMLQKSGRRPEDVRRTLNIPVVCGRTEAEQEARMRGVRHLSLWQGLPFEDLLQVVRDWPGLVGTPEEIVTQIHAFEAAGISELSLQWAAADDIEGLEILAAEVLPHMTNR
jgi:alkanesulfonate monooxygenase SsuD/methylene tetrahydromethanopterin reductase-like flavin-dependent oxidoreductase (luciferase family)